MRGIAIDPGDRWTGVAFFDHDVDEFTGEIGPWYCADVIEYDPWEFLDAFAETVLDPTSGLEWVVYERFRLYGDKAQEQKGSEFVTPQGIGVIKAVVRWHNQHVELHDQVEKSETPKLLTCEVNHGYHSINPPQHIKIFGQMADIKKPTAGICRTKKIKSVAGPIARENYGGRDHVKDAELHGIRYILKELGEPFTGA